MNVNATSPAAALAAQSEASQTARKQVENKKPSVSAPKETHSISRYADRQKKQRENDPDRGHKVNTRA